MILSKLNYYRIDNDKIGAECKIIQLDLTGFILPQNKLDNSLFKFLNIEHEFVNIVDWNISKYGKLWAYNLNYFDFLLQKDVSMERGLELIYNFNNVIQNNHIGLEPYPISIRGINWIKFLSKYKINDPQINSCLFNQYKLLVKRLEYHLLANHLLENGFSLLFASYFFKNLKWHNIASNLIQKELDNQILNDGAHFELSPMYHIIILERLLDSINLVSNNKCFDDEYINSLMRSEASKMLSWLNSILYSNQNYPMFNDSAHGIAADPMDIFEYASRLGLKSVKEIKPQESGVRLIRKKEFELAINCGYIKASYQPGHAHSNIGTYELNINGNPIIVDTGTSTYEKNTIRQVERSTCSHNTVTVNGLESVEVWDGFRVGSRPFIKVQEIYDTEICLEYKVDKKNNVKRIIQVSERNLLIQDSINSSLSMLNKSFIHFYPSINLTLKKNLLENTNFIIEFENSHNAYLVDYFYAKGFNNRISAKKLVIEFSNSLVYRIKIK